MSADLIRLLLVLAMVPFVTANLFLYGLGSPWYKSRIGWWLFCDVLGLMLLVDITVAYKFFGDNYSARDIVSITVFAIILAGAAFGTAVLAPDAWRKFKDWRERRNA